MKNIPRPRRLIERTSLHSLHLARQNRVSFQLEPCCFFRVGGCIAGDQAGAGLKRRVFKATLNENEDAASKLNNVISG